MDEPHCEDCHFRYHGCPNEYEFKECKDFKTIHVYKKMWKEIMLRCMVMSDPAFQEVIIWMRELEKENNG